MAAALAVPDELDVVAVGIEQEGAVVVTAVLRTRSRGSVVAVARLGADVPEKSPQTA
jgi:hypothetical protein